MDPREHEERKEVAENEERETASGYWVFCWVARFNDRVVITALVALKEHSVD